MLEALAACFEHLVHIDTMREVVRVESAGRQLAVNVNRYAGPQPRPATVDEAVAVAIAHIQAGRSVDLGRSQINSRNLPAMGLTVRGVLADDCANLRAGATILQACYARALRTVPEGREALLAALSCYNTGSLTRGFENGYVAKYVPALDRRPTVTARVTPAPQQRRETPQPTAAWGNLVNRGWAESISTHQPGDWIRVTTR